MIAKPTVEDLGIDPGAQEWQRSGDGNGAIEIAFARAARLVVPAAGAFPGAGGTGEAPAADAAYVTAEPPGEDNDAGQDAGQDAGWILMRVADDPERRVLVFDRNEWECFLDGARKGEFDDAADNGPA